MKRDMDLVLRILEFLEDREEISLIEDLEIPGYDNRVVAYHCRRMFEAGLLDGEAVTSSTTQSRLINVLPFGLTWQGHEFLDSMANKTVATQVKTTDDPLATSPCGIDDERTSIGGGSGRD